MRAYYVTIPLSIAFAGAGVFLAWSAKGNTAIPAISPVHPVSAEMEARARAKSAKKAPLFELSDSSGRDRKLSEFLSKPTLLYFIKDGCPCSIEAEPMIQALYGHLKGQANFVGIIGSPAKIGKEWENTHGSPYPVLSDETFATMRAYESPNSVYLTLIGTDGLIVKQWAGWSAKMLTEANVLIAQESGQPEKPFDTQYAPKADSSGCFFYSK
ncbi:MAG: redoxin domain-containing protein [Fimbriimonadaceae bacterium]